MPTISGAAIDSVVHEFIPHQMLMFGWETFDWDAWQALCHHYGRAIADLTEAIQ